MLSRPRFDQLQHLRTKTASLSLAIQSLKNEATSLLEITPFGGLPGELIQFRRPGQKGTTGRRVNPMARMMEGGGCGSLWPIRLGWHVCQWLRASHGYGSIHPSAGVSRNGFVISLKEFGAGHASALHESAPSASGSRFLLIAAQGGDLFPEMLGTLLITSGESHSQSKFQLLELMLAFGMAVGRIGRWLAPP